MQRLDLERRIRHFHKPDAVRTLYLEILRYLPSVQLVDLRPPVGSEKRRAMEAALLRYYAGMCCVRFGVFPGIEGAKLSMFHTSNMLSIMTGWA